MKLDWNLMRAILAHVESETIKDFLDDAEGMGKWKEGQLLSERADQTTDPAVRVVMQHIEMLVDSGYIKGIDVSQSLDGYYQYSLAVHPTLTIRGYSLLESLRTKGFIEKLTKYANEKSVPLTLETIKIVMASALPKFLG